MACDRFGKPGHAGQKFEVIADDGDGNDFVVGWTNNEDGGGLSRMVHLHPSWKNPRVRNVEGTKSEYGTSKANG